MAEFPQNHIAHLLLISSLMVFPTVGAGSAEERWVIAVELELAELGYVCSTKLRRRLLRCAPANYPVFAGISCMLGGARKRRRSASASVPKLPGPAYRQTRSSSGGLKCLSTFSRPKRNPAASATIPAQRPRPLPTLYKIQ